jgi:hypothetical protein
MVRPPTGFTARADSRQVDGLLDGLNELTVGWHCVSNTSSLAA